jgi:hypothetical protein
MNTFHFAALISATSLVLVPASGRADDLQNLKSNIMNDGTCYTDLRELTRDIGPRLSGSIGAERAVDWSVAKLNSYHLDRVWKQPVQVPHWERGTNERAVIMGGAAPISLAVAALGRSAGTPGIDAQVIEVQSLDEVRALGSRVRGKIVFYNRPMDPTLEDAFTAYGRAMDQRTQGPALASSLGAVAVLVRSMTTLPDDDHPHTGGTSFRSGATPIPAAALSTHAANVLSQELKNRPDLTAHIDLSAKTLPDVTSHNVIGEITGSVIPDEIVLVGGHLDSWDLAQGAHDDGAGITQSIDVCRAIKQLGLRPRRTVRCVMFMAEEPGGIGGEEYARQAGLAHEKHIMAVESDRGGFAPKKFSVDGTPSVLSDLRTWLPDFADTGVSDFYQGGSGTDVEPLAALGALTMEIIPDSTHYFDFHHASNDVFEAVNEKDLKTAAAALATMVYKFADRP